MYYHDTTAISQSFLSICKQKCCSSEYLHRMAGELIHDDGILWLVKSASDMLHENPECFLVFLRCHLATKATRWN